MIGGLVGADAAEIAPDLHKLTRLQVPEPADVVALLLNGTLICSLTLVSLPLFLLRHLPDASVRGIGKPFRTTSKSRLLFR